MTEYKTVGFILTYWRHIVAFVGIILAALWYTNREPAAPVGEHVVAKPSPIVKGVGKTTTKPVKVVVLKPVAKDKLVLPEEVKNNSEVHVATAIEIGPNLNPQTATVLLDEKTGEVTTLIRREPKPWLAWDYRGNAGIYAGWVNGQQGVRLQVRQGVFAVKAVHVGLMASIDQQTGAGRASPSSFIGVGLWGEWDLGR